MDDTVPAVVVPKPKYWGKVDRAALHDLIKDGSVDITKLNSKYIDTVQAQYFGHRDKKNFRRNFRDFAAANALESEYSGARRRQGEFLYYYQLINYLILLTPSPPLIFYRQRGQRRRRRRRRRLRRRLRRGGIHAPQVKKTSCCRRHNSGHENHHLYPCQNRSFPPRHA